MPRRPSIFARENAWVAPLFFLLSFCAAKQHVVFNIWEKDYKPTDAVAVGLADRRGTFNAVPWKNNQLREASCNTVHRSPFSRLQAQSHSAGDPPSLRRK